MFFKPKIYKHEGEAVALSLAWKIQDGPSGLTTSAAWQEKVGISWFLDHQERIVERELREHGFYKSSSNQKNKLAN